MWVAPAETWYAKSRANTLTSAAASTNAPESTEHQEGPGEFEGSRENRIARGNGHEVPQHVEARKLAERLQQFSGGDESKLRRNDLHHGIDNRHESQGHPRVQAHPCVGSPVCSRPPVEEMPCEGKGRRHEDEAEQITQTARSRVAVIAGYHVADGALSRVIARTVQALTKIIVRVSTIAGGASHACTRWLRDSGSR